MEKYIRDTITIRDDKGQKRDCTVEAFFDIDGETYCLLKDQDETVLMKVENEQYLIGVNNPQKQANILDAYNIALEAHSSGD